MIILGGNDGSHCHHELDERGRTGTSFSPRASDIGMHCQTPKMQLSYA